LSQKAQDKAAQAAKAHEKEIEGVGMERIADHYECATEVEDQSVHAIAACSAFCFCSLIL